MVDRIKKNSRLIIVAILFILILLSFSVFLHKPFNNDITLMLPAGSKPLKMLQALNDTGISGKFTVELELEKRCTNKTVLLKAIELLEQKLVHPEIKSAIFGFKAPDLKAVSSLYQILPGLADSDVIKQIRNKTSSEEIRKQMHNNYIRLLSPGGIGAGSFIEEDPLGLNMIVLRRFFRLSGAFSYKIARGATCLLGPDGRKALIVLNTDIPVMDIKRSKALLDFISAAVKNLNMPIKAKIICGHRHTIGNTAAIKRDVLVVAVASVIIFAIMFMIVYQFQLQCFYITLIPFASVLFAIALMSLFMDSISGFTVGLGGVIAGISVDYGIHVYMAFRNDGKRGVKCILRPLLGGALTTMGIFMAFFFTGVESYIQLGIFAVLSVLLSLLMSIYLLPILIGTSSGTVVGLQARLPVFSLRGSLLCIGGWTLLCFCGLLCSVLWLNFSCGVKTIDGAGADVFADEESFHNYWSTGKTSAMLVIGGDSKEAVLRRGEDIYEKMNVLTNGEYISPVKVIPSQKSRMENLQRWNELFTGNFIASLKENIISAGTESGFDKSAFDGFVRTLRAMPKQTDKGILNMFEKYFIMEGNDGWRLFTFFPDTPENYDAVEKIFGNAVNISLIFPEELRNAIGKELFNHLIHIAGIATVLVMILAMIATGSVGRGIIAMMPVAISLTTLAGLIALLEIPVSIPVFTAGIIVIGLGIDYGIFVVYQTSGKINGNVSSAVALSAMTTVAGAGTLLLAIHPLLFNMGIVLCFGVFMAFLAAFTLIPALGYFSVRGGQR